MKNIYLTFLLFILCNINLFGQSGIVGCYPLDNSATDNSGNNFNGTPFNLTSATDHLNNANGAFHFSGSSSYITLPITCFQMNEFTYSVWCKPLGLPNSGDYFSIISIGGSSADQHILLANDPSIGRVGFGAGTWSSSIQSHACYNGALPSTNQWFHLVMTRDNSFMNFYINDTLICTINSGGNAGYVSNPVATIGSRLAPNAQNFIGDIDDVQIFSRVLTMPEILNLNSTCPTINSSNCPVGDYSLANNAIDSSSNNLNGTAFNVTPTVDHLGNANGAYNFSGSNSYVSLPSSCFLLNDEFTYSVWCKPTNYPNSGNYYSVFSIGGNSADQHILLGNNSSLGQVGFGAGTWNSSLQSHACYNGALPALNQWYHLVMTRDNSNMNFYINNTLICTVISGGSAGYLNNPVATIGSRLAPNSQNFVGDIDDVKIFRRVLSLSEIQNISSICSPTGLSEIANDINATVYPNPSSNSFTLNINSLHQNQYKLILKDLLGRELQRWNGLTLSEQINFGANLSSGIYFIEISVGNNTKVLKLVKSN